MPELVTISILMKTAHSKRIGHYVGLFSCHAQKQRLLDGPPLVEALMNVDPQAPSAASNTQQHRVRLHEHTNFAQAGPSMPFQAPFTTYFPHFPQSMGPWSVQPYLKVPYPPHAYHEPPLHLWTHLESDSDWSFSFC